MNTPTAVYHRAPSQELKDLLSPGGFLAPLVELAGRKVVDHYHDVHFRVKDEVHVYRGLTRLVTVKRTSDGEVRLTADPFYQTQPCGEGFLRHWRLDEQGFGEELDRYLHNVKVDPSQFVGEGKVQEQWSQVNEPWIPFDREGRLGGPHRIGKDFPKVQAAMDELTALSPRNDWTPPKLTGVQIDQLAVDQKGRLVLLELKDASKGNAEVYYAPFQLMKYVWEWHDVLADVRAGLQAVVDARVAVGLTPPDVPVLTGGIRACVGFGPDQRTTEVRRRYELVLEVVNQLLPGCVGPIETWAFTDTGPRRVT